MKMIETKKLMVTIWFFIGISVSCFIGTTVFLAYDFAFVSFSGINPWHGAFLFAPMLLLASLAGFVSLCIVKMFRPRLMSSPSLFMKSGLAAGVVSFIPVLDRLLDIPTMLIVLVAFVVAVALGVYVSWSSRLV